MEEDILRAVGRLGGRQSRACCRDLCRMVEAAVPYMPETFSLEQLYPAAGASEDRSREALARSLSRAAEDVWENGDREELARLLGCRTRYKPAPKELIRALAMSVWLERRRRQAGASYRMIESDYPRRIGVVGESGDPPVRLVVLMPDQERDAVERMVEHLNRERTSLEEAELFLLRDTELTRF